MLNSARQTETPSFGVLIIGAGLAGLAAGYRLQQLGVRYAIVEASSRAGGRTLTVRAPDDTVVDLGGEHIATFHRSTKSLCFELGLELTTTPSGSLDSLLPDAIQVRRRWLADAAIAKLRIELRRIIEQLVSMSGGIDPTCPWEGDRAEAWNAVSVDEWLVSQGVSIELSELFSDLPRRGQSLLGLLSLVASGSGYPFFLESECHTIRGGTASLVSALRSKVAGNLQFNARVASIRQVRHRVAVDVALGGVFEYLVAENHILRAHLPKRLRLTDKERLRLADIGKRLGRKLLAQVACTAKPETILKRAAESDSEDS